MAKGRVGSRQFKGARRAADVAIDPFPSEWPAHFSALTENERKFVWAYVANGGNGSAAAKASYQCKSNTAANANAGRTLARPDVQAAILAHSKVALRELAPLAVRTLKDILSDPSSKDRIKAVRTILERTDGVVQKTELAVHVSADEQAMQLLKYLLSVNAGQAALEAAFGASLPRFMAMLPQKVIEHVPAD